MGLPCFHRIINKFITSWCLMEHEYMHSSKTLLAQMAQKGIELSQASLIKFLYQTQSNSNILGALFSQTLDELGLIDLSFFFIVGARVCHR